MEFRRLNWTTPLLLKKKLLYPPRNLKRRSQMWRTFVALLTVAAQMLCMIRCVWRKNIWLILCRHDIDFKKHAAWVSQFFVALGSGWPCSRPSSW